MADEIVLRGGCLCGNLRHEVRAVPLYLGDYEEAVRHIKLCCVEMPHLAFARYVLASACALAGRMEEARAALEEFREMRPGVGIAALRREALSEHPKYLLLRERLYEGLRLVGMED
ncbi:MAG TPA: hypothetical protein VGP71_05365 [Burkholderiales bacterium]|jgi:tetratricopeptide (TPR) repeat protein|nr:hypothetical protein [Burkholderiales bacterium]